MLYSSASEFVTVSYRIVPYRTVSYRIVPYLTVSYRTVSYRIVSYRIVPYRIVSYRIVPYRTVPFSVFVNREFGPGLKHNRTKKTTVFRFIYFSRDVTYFNANR